MEKINKLEVVRTSAGCRVLIDGEECPKVLGVQLMMVNAKETISITTVDNGTDCYTIGREK